MNLKDLKNKRITVMGLGRLGGGVEVVKFLARHGAKLLVTDIKKKEELSSSLEQLKGFSNIEFVLGQHRKEDFIERDFVVKNPDIPKMSPYLRAAREKGIPIETDISIFFKLAPCYITGVTGTKGKSTTASLCYELLKHDYDAFLAGNIGVTPLAVLEKVDVNSLVVLELSSWQLEDLEEYRISPYVSVILNIYPDHLNRHASLDDYIDAKKIIIRFGKENSTAILNYDDELVRGFRSECKGKVYYFSSKTPTNGAFLENAAIFFGEDRERITGIDEVSLKGEHNVTNILAAVTAAKVYKVKTKTIHKVLGEFSGIAYREEKVREVHGISFYNDTTATIPEATIAALKRLRENVILIAGGMDKKLDYGNLAREMRDRVKLVILLPGDASDKIDLQLTTYNLQLKRERVNDMQEAVKVAFKNAQSGDNVILSPGAASFNVFKNEFDRGEQFNKAVNNL